MLNNGLPHPGRVTRDSGHVAFSAEFGGILRNMVRVVRWLLKVCVRTMGRRSQWNTCAPETVQRNRKLGALYILQRVVLKGVWFRGVVLKGLWFRGVVLKGVWFRGVVLKGVWFRGVVLKGLWFRGVVLKGVWFRGVVLKGLWFRGVSRRVWLRNVDILNWSS